MPGTWRCKQCGNLNREEDLECLDCTSGEWAEPDARVAVGRRYSLTKDEWVTVQLSPLWTYKLVAEIDGRPDNQERQALIMMLNSGQLFESFLLREACGAVARDMDVALVRQSEDSRSLEEVFCDLGRVIDGALPPPDAEGFKKDLLALGVTIATASGGGLFGGENKMSELEGRALSFMASILGIEPLTPGTPHPCPRSV